ncbi:MAG TPA: hypothetical protein VIN61_08990 [Gammaproteobacteria bacterium]
MIRPVAMLLALAAAGCAAVTTVDGERLGVASDEFRDYAERVFREQNRVATDLAFAIEEAEIRGFDAPEALVRAEERLLEACAGLNELAARRRDQRRVGARRGLAAARQAPRCEAAAREAAALLDQ